MQSWSRYQGLHKFPSVSSLRQRFRRSDPSKWEVPLVCVCPGGSRAGRTWLGRIWSYLARCRLKQGAVLTEVRAVNGELDKTCLSSKGAKEIVHLYIAGPVLQVDCSPPACSQISACSPKSTREEAEERVPLFALSLLMPGQIWCQSSGSEMNLHLLRIFLSGGSTFVYIHSEKK